MKIIENLAESHILQIVKYSNTDPLIIQNTHDSQRFKDVKSFEKWFSKGKFVYALTDSEKNLQGIVWFGRKKPPAELNLAGDYTFTFSIRIYPDIRGKGWSEKLMKLSFKKFIKSHVYKRSKEKKFWLSTHKDNIIAIKIYTKFGFIKRGALGNYLIFTYDF